MAKAKSKSKAAPKKAVKKAATKKAATKGGLKASKKSTAKKGKKALPISCPDLTNEVNKNGDVVIPSVQERLEKKRALQAYLKQERDPQKRNAARKAWGPWFKGKAA